MTRLFSSRSLLGVLFGALAVVSFAEGGDSAEKLLREVRDKADEHRFAALKKVTIRDPKGEFKTFEERVLRSRKVQRIDYPGSSPFAGQVVIERDGKRQTYYRASNEIRESRSREFRDLYDFSWIQRQREGRDRFDWELKDGDKVAGEPTKVLVLRQGDTKRQVLWVHSRRRLVMKREMYDGRGNYFGGFEYKKIDFDPRIRSGAFDLPDSAKVVSPKDDLKRIAKEMRMAPYTLDGRSGFELMLVRNDKIDGKEALRQFFDSGSQRVSLFQVKDMKPKGFVKEGRVNVYSFSKSGVTLMLVGDLDESTMRRLSSQIVTQQPE